jgi:hypothetical protein
VPLAAVGIDQHGVGAVEGAVVIHRLPVDHPGRPAVGVHVDSQARYAGECFLHEHRAGAELVHAGRMAGATGDEHESPGCLRFNCGAFAGPDDAGRHEQSSDCR